MNELVPSALSMAEHEHEIHMERFETMLKREIHPEIAVTAALHYCAEHQMPPPQWLTMAATKLLCALIGNKQKKKRGRSVSPCARYLQDMIVYERSDVVRDTRERQISEREHVEKLRKIPSAPKALIREREKMLACAGSDWLEAFVCASKRLQTTDAHAGPDAIKKSYLEYQRESRGRISGLRYHVFDRRLLNMLGIAIDFPHRGKKLRPIYDLTT
jgi:hypothetical protein